MTKSALDRIGAIADQSGEHISDRPERASFEDFLLHDARVPIGGGEHGPYSFEGREAIRAIVRRIDLIIGATPAEALPDSLLGVAGGAQWGKTILELNLAAYLTGQRFLNAGMFLPDDNLVQGIVDTKLRPDVVDQIPWFAEMTQIGKVVNKSGKTANRKGAFLVTDGRRRANGMVLGLQKIPTSFTFDVTLQDEVDDIPEKNARFVRGRRTASPLRFDVRIGTQRIQGRGQNKVWKDGSQGVVVLGPIGEEIGQPSDEVLALPDGWVNPEESFPDIIRCAVTGSQRADDPKLTWAGDFKRDGNQATVCTHNPQNVYYLAHPETGAPLNRRHPLWHHRVPERFNQRKFTFRAAQLDFDAIGLSQIVHQFTEENEGAISSSEAMTVFRCDVLALPQSTAQALEPSILDRARNVDPFDVRMRLEPGRSGFAGLDTGDRCYFYVREREDRGRKRLIHASAIPAGDVVSRAVSLFDELKLSALFIDQRPLVSQARSIALHLNGLDSLRNWPDVPQTNDAYISLPGGLTWDGRNGTWRNLRCAVVRFDKKQLGAGIEQGFDIYEEGGQTKFVPLIRCNRYETIDRAVREFLTPDEGIVEVIDGAVRETPAMLLPQLASSPILSTVDAHLITGSEREKEEDGTLGDYVDQVANHFLLADGYSALAELVAGEGQRGGPATDFKAFPRGARFNEARNREVMA